MFFTRTSYGFTKRKTQVGGTQGPCNHCALCCCNEGCISMVLVVSQWPVDMPCMWRQCARNVFFFPTNPCWVQSRNFLVKHISKECVATAKCIFPLQIFKTWLQAWVRISTQNLKFPCQTKPDMCKLQHLNGAFVTCKDQHFHHTVKYFSKRWTTHRDAWNKSDKNCCKISGGVAWNVWFTTNGMCAKNNNTAYTNVGRTSNNRVIAARDLYCCLLPQCKASRTCCSGFPIATKWCCDQDAMVVPCETFTQRAVRSVRFVVKRRGCCCSISLECAIPHEQDVREEQHPYICGANKQYQSDHSMWTLLLLAATVRSFAHMPLGIFQLQQNNDS